MASSAARRMNLTALQQQDPYITEIVDTATQVALYSFNAVANEWEKTDVEGTLFVYTRSASPSNGFTIMNRLSMDNMTQPITKDLEFQVNDPFLLYRNTKGASICGIWFYDKDECARLGHLMTKLTHEASLPDTSSGTAVLSPSEETDVPSDREQTSQIDIMQMLTKAQSDYKKSGSESQKTSSDAGSTSSGSTGAAQQQEEESQTDIMQLLSKAQDEYTRKTQQTPKKEEPKHITRAPPPANAVVSQSNLVKPVAVKVNVASPKMNKTQTVGPPYSDAHNQQRKRQQKQHMDQQNPLPPAPAKSGEVLVSSSGGGGSGGGGGDGGAPGQPHESNLLQRLMSNPGVTSVHMLEQEAIGAPAAPSNAHSQAEDSKIAAELLQKLQFVQDQQQQREVKSQPIGIPTVSQHQLPLQPSPGKFHGGHPTQGIVGAMLTTITQSQPSIASVTQSSVANISHGAGQTVQPLSTVAGNALLQGLAQGHSAGVTSSPNTGRSRAASMPMAVNKPTGTELLSPMVFQSKTSQPIPSLPCNQTVSMSTAAASLPSNQSLSGLSNVYSALSPLNKQPPAGYLQHPQSVVVPTLTKEQLKQALLNIIQTDDDFVSEIHKAYLKSVSKT